MASELSKKSKIHLKTGGTHATMLCSIDGEVLAFAEDVGRHNAPTPAINRRDEKNIVLSLR